MTYTKYDELSADVAAAVDEAIAASRIVNVAVIADRIRRRHERLNIALEDIELLVLQCAEYRRFPVEFDGSEFLADHRPQPAAR